MIADRQLVDETTIDEAMALDAQLRQRLRAVILELIPNKWGIRGTLFHLIDRAPSSAILAMRDRIRDLLT